MATLDDKLLGEKVQNYISSSEDEAECDGKPCDSLDPDKRAPVCVKDKLRVKDELPTSSSSIQGPAKRTGPKGVLQDWEKYKELQKRGAKPLVPLEQESTPIDADDLDIEAMLDELMLQKKKELMNKPGPQHPTSRKIFGELLTLTSKDSFMHAIDDEDANTFIIILIYDDGVRGCKAMQSCFYELAESYRETKFCQVKSLTAGMSMQFRLQGLPALQIYKNKELVESHIQLCNEFGDEALYGDVEHFLIQKGVLEDERKEVRVSVRCFDEGESD